VVNNEDQEQEYRAKGYLGPGEVPHEATWQEYPKWLSDSSVNDEQEEQAAQAELSRAVTRTAAPPVSADHSATRTKQLSRQPAVGTASETRQLDLHFSLAQRTSLCGLGVTGDQIAELEKILPLCRVMVVDDPTLRDVRDKLKAIVKAVERLNLQLAPPPKANVKLAQLEALNRIQKASRDCGGDCGEADKCIASLHQLRPVIDKALNDLGTTQRRTNSAATGPIKLIDDALKLGWAKHTRRLIQQGSTNALPLNIRASRHLSSQFSGVVRVCYEAMTGKEDCDPERAIRSYIFWYKRQRTQLSAQRAEME
jgi:hypothetical protein